MKKVQPPTASRTLHIVGGVRKRLQPRHNEAGNAKLSFEQSELVQLEHPAVDESARVEQLDVPAIEGCGPVAGRETRGFTGALVLAVAADVYVSSAAIDWYGNATFGARRLTVLAGPWVFPTALCLATVGRWFLARPRALALFPEARAVLCEHVSAA